MEWKLNEQISDKYVKELAKKLNTDELLVRIVLNRNNDESFADLVLNNIDKAIIAPEKLVNAKEVADRITEHIKNGSYIFIHGDYDVDGLDAGYIMYDIIRNIIDKTNSKARLDVYFPERKYGYGLSMHYIDVLFEIMRIDKLKPEEMLIITVDNGIAQIEQIDKLIKNNIEVVVTDHHPSSSKVPNCLICDPHNAFVEQDNTYKHLCGAGVAFKVGELLQKNFGFHDVYKYVANVAIATIADVMPLTTENISFIQYGMDIINNDNLCPAGIKRMKDFLGIDFMNPSNIAWEIGPRLNSCGRMGDTSLGAQLLMIEDYDEATDIVNQIELLNEKRKEITDIAKQEISKMDFSNDYVAIIKLEDIPEGVVGPLAGHAVTMFEKPSIVATEIEDGIMIGSARSIPGFDLRALFEYELAEGNIISYGGHSEAAGIGFYKDKLQDLRRSINNTINQLCVKRTSDSCDVPEPQILLIDKSIRINDLTRDTFDLINLLPYDNSMFNKPIFMLNNCEVTDFTPTKKKPENLWLTVKQGRLSLKLWCQGMTETYSLLNCPKKVNLIGYVEKNFMSSGRPYTFKVIDIVSAI